MLTKAIKRKLLKFIDNFSYIDAQLNVVAAPDVHYGK